MTQGFTLKVVYWHSWISCANKPYLLLFMIRNVCETYDIIEDK